MRAIIFHDGISGYSYSLDICILQFVI